MLSVEARACAQIRPSSQKVVHALTRQALSNLENASTRSGISNLRGWWSLVARVVPSSASIMLHKRNSRQVQHDARTTSNISAMSSVVAAGGEDSGTKVPLLIIGAGAAGLWAAPAAQEAGGRTGGACRDATPPPSPPLSP